MSIASECSDFGGWDVGQACRKRAEAREGEEGDGLRGWSRTEGPRSEVDGPSEEEEFSGAAME